jgi:hypothetical protein
MRTIRRAMVAGALALPLTLGTAGIASADTSYNENSSFAGPDGASTYSVSSWAGTGDNGYYGGGASFEESESSASADGAYSHDVSTSTGDNGYDNDNDYEETYEQDDEGLLGGLLGL